MKPQISGTAIVTKFAAPYAYIFRDTIETEFRDKELLKPWVWLRYINIFFLRTHGEENLQTFLENLNNVQPDVRFTSEISV